MSNETTLKVKVKLEGLEDAHKQIEMMEAEFEKLKFMASRLSETLENVSLNFDKFDDYDGGNANA